MTGAKHIGGVIGHKWTKKETHKAPFEQIKWSAFQDEKQCKDLKTIKKVLYVDGSDHIKDHNDILDTETGTFLWSAIKCFAPYP